MRNVHPNGIIFHGSWPPEDELQPRLTTPEPEPDQQLAPTQLENRIGFWFSDLKPNFNFKNTQPEFDLFCCILSVRFRLCQAQLQLDLGYLKVKTTNFVVEDGSTMIVYMIRDLGHLCGLVQWYSSAKKKR